MPTIATSEPVGDPQERIDPGDLICSWRNCHAEVVQVREAIFCMKHMLAAKRSLDATYASAIALHRPTIATNARRPRVTGEVVYFMRKGDKIKIGYTGNLQRRSYALQPDEVLGYFPGDRDTEAKVHDIFAPWSLGHEWYRATPECLALIETVLPGAADTAIAA